MGFCAECMKHLDPLFFSHSVVDLLMCLISLSSLYDPILPKLSLLGPVAAKRAQIIIPLPPC